MVWMDEQSKTMHTHTKGQWWGLRRKEGRKEEREREREGKGQSEQTERVDAARLGESEVLM